MDTNSKSKPKKAPTLRIIVTENNVSSLDLWIGQLEQFCPGIRLKRQDLVNWLIEEKGGLLSPNDLKRAKEQFYGEIELARWALDQLKAAKARNEKVTLNDLLRGGKSNDTDVPRKRSKSKASPALESELPQSEVAGENNEPTA
jgi:hypothetical protein